ncbi:hypothetical protein QAD02_014247, partial [Eretmocerus hayati]
VSKEEYETCRITNPSPRVIAICDKPFKTMYFTITFRPYTPQPGGLEFHPGRDYYFISTSSKDDLHRRIGGRCTTNNMKVVFKVCCNNEADSNSYPATSRNNLVPVTTSTTSSSSSSSTSTAVSGQGSFGPAAMPPSVYKGAERYYPAGGSYQQPPHGQDSNQLGQHRPDQPGMGPTLSHVPQPPMFYPPHQQPPQLSPMGYPPMQPGSTASQPSIKTSVTHKKKN